MSVDTARIYTIESSTYLADDPRDFTKKSSVVFRFSSCPITKKFIYTFRNCNVRLEREEGLQRRRDD